MSNETVRPWPPDSHKTVSGIPAVVHTLSDGTKVTMVPTMKNANVTGKSYLDKVAITKDGKRTEIHGFHSSAGPHIVKNELNGQQIDNKYHDGNTLRTGHEIDDLVTMDGTEIVGTDNGKEHLLDGLGGIWTTNGGPTDIHARIMAVLSKLNGDLGVLEDMKDAKKRLEDEGKEVTRKALFNQVVRPQDPNAEDRENVFNRAWPKDRESPPLLEGELERATSELQRVQNLKAQYMTMLASIQQSEHQARMAILQKI